MSRTWPLLGDLRFRGSKPSSKGVQTRATAAKVKGRGRPGLLPLDVNEIGTVQGTRGSLPRRSITEALKRALWEVNANPLDDEGLEQLRARIESHRLLRLEPLLAGRYLTFEQTEEMFRVLASQPVHVRTEMGETLLLHARITPEQRRTLVDNDAFDSKLSRLAAALPEFRQLASCAAPGFPDFYAQTSDQWGEQIFRRKCLISYAPQERYTAAQIRALLGQTRVDSPGRLKDLKRLAPHWNGHGTRETLVGAFTTHEYRAKAEIFLDTLPPPAAYDGSLAEPWFVELLSKMGPDVDPPGPEDLRLLLGAHPLSAAQLRELFLRLPWLTHGWQREKSLGEELCERWDGRGTPDSVLSVIESDPRLEARIAAALGRSGRS